ncbi:MAG: sensor histidine kinase [Lachnospiraceae bacterium]|nr:sensor histidine kinase [Lachnospiraceae bacterium]
MTDKVEMELFLREMLMQIENEQGQLIRKLEEYHIAEESLNREKELIEEKLKDNISFFSPASASGREKLEEINERILAGHDNIEQTRRRLDDINGKIVTMGNILAFVRDSKIEEKPETFRPTGVFILETQELERKRIARDLHDSTVQNLTNLVHKTEYCSKMIEKDPVQVKLELVAMMDNIRHTIDDMRRIIYDLRPMSIDDLGLVPTVQRYVEEYKRLYPDVEVNVYVKSNVEELELSSLLNLTLFRIIQESCNNIYKYAQANTIDIEFIFEEDFMSVSIKDDGIGFTLEDVKRKNIEEITSGYGLSIMKERAQLLGGKLEIESEPSCGTTVKMEIPYNIEDDKREIL